MPRTTHPPTKNRVCICRGCGESFGGLTAFDLHRSGGWCLDPAAVGLRFEERPKGTLWAYAQDVDRIRAFRRIAA